MSFIFPTTGFKGVAHLDVVESGAAGHVSEGDGHGGGRGGGAAEERAAGGGDHDGDGGGEGH